MITKSSDADIADWGLELNQRVSTIVWVGWASLAAGTEIGIVADSALVSVTLDVCLSSHGLSADRTIAVYSVVG